MAVGPSSSIQATALAWPRECHASRARSTAGWKMSSVSPATLGGDDVRGATGGGLERQSPAANVLRRGTVSTVHDAAVLRTTREEAALAAILRAAESARNRIPQCRPTRCGRLMTG